jgi:hypothetical protein
VKTFLLEPSRTPKLEFPVAGLYPVVKGGGGQRRGFWNSTLRPMGESCYLGSPTLDPEFSMGPSANIPVTAQPRLRSAPPLEPRPEPAANIVPDDPSPDKLYGPRSAGGGGESI